MQYVSTRGEASSLGFVDVMLAGLARDGGLYVPVAWPQLDPRAIAGFAGRPYAEVAVEIIRPFVGGEIPEHELARMISRSLRQLPPSGGRPAAAVRSERLRA